MDYANFKKYTSEIRSSKQPVARDRRFLMEEQDSISVYYTPFDHINESAQIALVGITPGPTQMVNGIVEARRSLESGGTSSNALIKAKEVAAFSGEPMRSNLISQLNHWGFQKWLGIDDCSQLFGMQSHLVHSTSLLRYPVFVHGKDYAGNPNMMRTPILRKYLLEYFVQEVKQLSKAVFLSLGPKVSSVLQQLVKDGYIGEDRVINGLLHPSGNNTYRLNWLTGSRVEEVPYKTNPVPFDAGMEKFRQYFLV